MTLAPVKKPLYPDVPQGAGIPPVKRFPLADFNAGANKAIILLADAVTVLRFFQGPRWGVFTKTGAEVVVSDSVISVDFRREWRVSDYPVEDGGFETYDKVSEPYDARVRLACDGSTTPRSFFLSQIDAAARSLDLFTVVTPDAVFPSVNIIHYDYRRDRAGGVGIILVDIWLREIRQTVQSTFTSTKTPDGASDQNSGTVQSGTPTTSQSSSLLLKNNSAISTTSASSSMLA